MLIQQCMFVTRATCVNGSGTQLGICFHVAASADPRRRRAAMSTALCTPSGGCCSIDSTICVSVLYSHTASIVVRALQLVPSSDFCAGSLPRPPRLGALPAVPRHPVRALAVFPTVVRTGVIGGAARAVLEALLRTIAAQVEFESRVLWQFIILMFQSLTSEESPGPDILQWLLEHDCPMEEDTCPTAALHGHLEVLKWAREHGCVWDETCASAAQGGHLAGGVEVGADAQLPVGQSDASAR